VGEGLSSERSYALRVLPVAMARGVRAAATGRDRAGALRSLAILAGLLVTSAGYVLGRLDAARTGSPRPEGPR
jgi:hypothetical protein